MRAFSGASLATAALALSVSVGCSQVGQVQAKRSFKAANAAYQAQDYKKAAGLYEETLKADPNLSIAYFFLGNSLDNMYKPSKAGQADNDALLTFLTERLRAIDGVLETETFVYLRILKQNYEWGTTPA